MICAMKIFLFSLLGALGQQRLEPPSPVSLTRMYVLGVRTILLEESFTSKRNAGKHRANVLALHDESLTILE
jgi:hypothetical protein